MQTFLPLPDFKASVRALDMRRLCKQRSETKIILAIIEGEEKTSVPGIVEISTKKAWSNHPATRMWRGYSQALRLYQRETITEWVNRGYKNNMELPEITNKIVYPPWFGDYDFHASHRSNLLRKNPDFYGRWVLGWTEHPNMEYIWPS